MTRSVFLSWLLLLSGALRGGPVSSPQRIISLSPNTTEMLYGIGAFDRVVAVSQYCTFPPAVNRLPRVGGWQDTDIEKVASLRPDLVVVTDAQVPFVADHLAALGLRTLAVPSQTLNDVFSAITLIGQAIGQTTKAAALAARTRSTLDDVQRRCSSLSQPTVILCISRTPGTLNDLYVAAGGSYLVDLLSLAGGRSLSPTEHGYAKMSKEALLTLNPDVIIDLQHTHNSSLNENTEEVWGELKGLRAVQNHRVYTITDDFAVHASQFVANTAEEFARALHPDAFPKARS